MNAINSANLWPPIWAWWVIVTAALATGFTTAAIRRAKGPHRHRRRRTYQAAQRLRKAADAKRKAGR